MRRQGRPSRLHGSQIALIVKYFLFFHSSFSLFFLDFLFSQGTFDGIEPIKITGPRDSLFGQVVANIGDLNGDQYEGEYYGGKRGKLKIMKQTY